MFRSNLGLAPEELTEPISTALSIHELYRAGARFDYPNGLSAFEWASLKGLTRGHDRAEELRAKRERKKAKRKSKSKNG